MHSLREFEPGDMTYFDLARTSRYGTRASKQHLENIRLEVVDAVADYRRRSPHALPPQAIPLSSAEKKTLKTAYVTLASATHGSGLRSAVLLNPSMRAEYCPYCGLERAREIDHFLPKELFPEHAVVPVNLVPACHTCNHAKRAKIPKVNGVRFRHAYLDAEISSIFLIARVEFVSGRRVPSFHLVQPRAMSSPDFQNVSYQTTELDLLARFGHAGAIELDDNASTIDAFRLAGVDELNRWLSEKVSGLESSYGLNNWKTALYRGLGIHLS